MKDFNRIPAYRRALQTSLAGALRNAGDETLKAIDKGFENGTTAMNEPWAPLADSTVEQKGHDTILVDEGDLRDSFKSRVDWSPIGAKRLVIYSEDEKLAYHEFGTETMPRRPVMEPAARYLANNALDDELPAALVAAERAVGIQSL